MVHNLGSRFRQRSIFYFLRKVKDHPTQYSSDGSITVSDVMINVTGDDGDDTRQVLVSKSV